MSLTSGVLDNVKSQSRTSAWTDKILPAFLAGMLGVLLIFCMGFAKTPQLHNAAHDGRHSAGFPCH